MLGHYHEVRQASERVNSLQGQGISKTNTPQGQGNRFEFEHRSRPLLKTTPDHPV